MADVREETEFHIIDFFILRHLIFYLLKMKLLTFTFQHPVARQEKHDHQTGSIQQISPPRHPERRIDYNTQRGFLYADITVAIDRFHSQNILSWGKIRKSHIVYSYWQG